MVPIAFLKVPSLLIEHCGEATEFLRGTHIFPLKAEDYHAASPISGFRFQSEPSNVSIDMPEVIPKPSASNRLREIQVKIVAWL